MKIKQQIIQIESMKVHYDVTLESSEIEAIHIMAQVIRDLVSEKQIEEHTNASVYAIEVKMAELIHSYNKFNETTIKDAP